MSEILKICVILVLGLASVQNSIISGEQLEPLLPLDVDNLAICGGSIESDSDSVTYGPVAPGEICVWTIHLQTRNGFSLNFSQFNVQSQYNDCRDGVVRIYALTNLVSPDETQSYE